MKLSEAILLGSVGTEQGFGIESMYCDAPGRCALGAALAAVGKSIPFSEAGTAYVTVRDLWPWTYETWVNNPSSCTKVFAMAKVMDIIWDLNDCAKWTRPQIAAWVATIEPHIDERKCDPNEVSAQEQAKTETVHVPEPESVNII